ncbi:MAG: hypothetical protein WD273_03890 [Trueperaceae bacterium]
MLARRTPAPSRRIKVFRAARLVRVEERGRERWYQLDAQTLGEFVAAYVLGITVVESLLCATVFHLEQQS